MPFHIRFRLKPPLAGSVVRVDLAKEQLDSFFLIPFHSNGCIINNGNVIQRSEITEVRISETHESYGEILPLIKKKRIQDEKSFELSGLSYVNTTEDEWYAADYGTDRTDEFLRNPPQSDILEPSSSPEYFHVGIRIKSAPNDFGPIELDLTRDKLDSFLTGYINGSGFLVFSNGRHVRMDDVTLGVRATTEPSELLIPAILERKRTSPFTQVQNEPIEWAVWGKGRDVTTEIIRDLRAKFISNTAKNSPLVNYTNPPVEILDSLARFVKEHPDSAKAAFIMMQFGQTAAHDKIVTAIRKGLENHGIKGLRADDNSYHDDLLPNVLTYLWGCGMGIAVYERLEDEAVNPNVSLEVGYLLALRKPVCLLKDKTLRRLNTDLIGKIHVSFDPQSPGESIPAKLSRWLTDKGLI